MPAKEENAEYAICPRCGEKTLRLDRPALNALSRADNTTYVCSDCGINEALEDYQRGMSRTSMDNWKAPEAATLKLHDTEGTGSDGFSLFSLLPGVESVPDSEKSI